MIFVVKHRSKIFRNAFHTPRADGLNACLLDRFKYCAALLTARRKLAMNGVVVARHAQRDGICVPAHDGRFFEGQFSCRLRQPHLATDSAGALRSKRHFKFRRSRNRAQTARHRTLERFVRRFLDGGFRLDVGRHGLRNYLAELSLRLDLGTLHQIAPFTDRIEKHLLRFGSRS